MTETQKANPYEGLDTTLWDMNPDGTIGDTVPPIDDSHKEWLGVDEWGSTRQGMGSAAISEALGSGYWANVPGLPPYEDPLLFGDDSGMNSSDFLPPEPNAEYAPWDDPFDPNNPNNWP